MTTLSHPPLVNTWSCGRCTVTGSVHVQPGDHPAKKPHGWWVLSRQRHDRKGAVMVGCYCAARCLLEDAWNRLVDVEQAEPWDSGREPVGVNVSTCRCGMRARGLVETSAPAGWYYLHQGPRRAGIVCSASCATDRVLEVVEFAARSAVR